MGRHPIGRLWFAFIVGVVALGVCGVGCSVNVLPGEGISASFTAAGKTVSLKLGAAGYFELSIGNATLRVADVQPFDEPPTDHPTSASVLLRPANVTVRPAETTKTAPGMQSALSGTANLRVLFDQPGAATPCTTGMDAGSFQIQVTGGEVAAVSDELDLNDATIDLFVRNQLSMCLEMTGDFEGTVEVAELNVAFGPAPAGGDSPGGVLVASQETAFPGQFVTLHHPSIEPGRPVVVEFRGPDGYLMSVDAGRVSAGAATVGVPPYMDMSTGNIGAGTVTVGLRGTPGTVTMQIEDLVDVGSLPPGDGVIVFLESIIDEFTGAQERLDRLVDEFGASPEATELSGHIQEAITSLGDLVTEIQTTGQLVLDFPDGVVTIDAAGLNMLDRHLGGILLGIHEDLGLADGADISKLRDRMAGAGEVVREMYSGMLRRARDTGLSGAEAVVVGLSAGVSAWGLWQVVKLGAAGVAAIGTANVALIGSGAILVGGGLYLAVTSLTTESGLSHVEGRRPELWRDSEEARKILVRTGTGLAENIAPSLLPKKLQNFGTALNVLHGVHTTNEKLGEVGCDQLYGGPSEEQKRRLPYGKSAPNASELGLGSMCTTLWREPLLEGDPSGGCSDTCEFAFDGHCDDGGAGSDFLLCDLGTDCADCGRRELIDPSTIGACCSAAGECVEAAVATCTEDVGATFLGAGTLCEPTSCEPPVDYVVWYTGNVCCWGAPLLYITDRTGFEAPALRSSFPGGGIDPTTPVVKVEYMGGFESAQAAQDWVCPRFVSSSFHFWCGRHYQMDGRNWQPTGSLGCDLGDLPEPASYPDVDTCAE